MQILSNALPGFRDLRGPIVAGYMWLLFAWLLVAPDIDNRPDDKIGAAVYDLAHDVSRVGVAFAVSVAAYLIGSISQEGSRVLRRFGSRLVRGRPGFLLVADVHHRAVEKVRDATSGLAARPSAEKVVDNLISLTETYERGATEHVDQELNLPGTLLLGDRPELFAEVDRLRAEGDLRLAVVPPALALIVLLALQVSVFWLVAVLGVILLFVQGLQRESDSRKMVSDAIYFGRIESSSVKRYEAWVDNELPVAINKRLDEFARVQETSDPEIAPSQ